MPHNLLPFPGCLFSLGGKKRDPGNDVATTLLYSSSLTDKQHVCVQFK